MRNACKDQIHKVGERCMEERKSMRQENFAELDEVSVGSPC